VAGGRRELHPNLSPEERRRLFLEGIELFNHGEFYDSHEVWEDIWRSTTPEPKNLFQGLIQVAAALHQFLDLKRQEAPGRTLAKARARLEPYAPVACGLDVAALLDHVGVWEAWLEKKEGELPPVPLLRVLDPAAVA
jgi:predicted metal-dependent hydrolase